MENELFFSVGIPPSSLLEMQAQASQESLFSPMAESNIQYDSAISSMVSSPVASNSNVSNESFMIRELIGKLGNIGNSPASYFNGNGNNSGNTSSYGTPLNSPPKISLPPLMNHGVKESFSQLPLSSSLAELSPDPGFAERAAKFSCLGSRSSNGRTRMNSSELVCRSNSAIGNGKLSRVSSSPSIKAFGSQGEKKNSPLQERAELANSQDESTVSEHKTNGVASSEPNSRKRKSLSRGKTKDSGLASPSAKVGENNEDSNAKRCKPNEGDNSEKVPVKADEERRGNFKASEEEKQPKTNQKPPEPPKDYIHVRARRGQATDSHSLAERVRREKISERMKLLQNLVPGCNKVTGKALMLDEIINYVQSLQCQVEFLSMKLASVNTRMDFNVETLVSKEMYQMPQSVFPLDSSAPVFYGHQPQQNQALSVPISNGTVTQCSVDPLDSTLCQNFGMQLLPLSNGFSDAVPQYPRLCEDDLQTIVQMGFGKNLNPGAGLQSQS